MRFAVPLSFYFPISSPRDACNLSATSNFPLSFQPDRPMIPLRVPLSLENFSLVFHDISNHLRATRHRETSSLFIRNIIDSSNEEGIPVEGRREGRMSKFNFTSWRSLPQVRDAIASSKLPGHVWKEVSFLLLRVYVLCVYTHGTRVHGIVSPCLNGANRNGNNTPCLGQVSTSLETPIQPRMLLISFPVSS